MSRQPINPRTSSASKPSSTPQSSPSRPNSRVPVYDFDSPPSSPTSAARLEGWERITSSPTTDNASEWSMLDRSQPSSSPSKRGSSHPPSSSPAGSFIEPNTAVTSMVQRHRASEASRAASTIQDLKDVMSEDLLSRQHGNAAAKRPALKSEEEHETIYAGSGAGCSNKDRADGKGSRTRQKSDKET